MEARGRATIPSATCGCAPASPRAAIERLADADAFRSLGLDRRDALWAARGIGAMKPADKLPLFDVAAHGDIRKEPDFHLPPMPLGEHVVNDYRYLSLSLKAHPVSFLREQLAARRVVANASLKEIPNNRRTTVAGLVIIRQRPGTAKGVIFMTLEDETDIANVIVWPKTFEVFRPVVLGARLVAVTGKLQSESGVIHVVADKLEDLTPMLAALSRGRRRPLRARPRRRGQASGRRQSRENRHASPAPGPLLPGAPVARHRPRRAFGRGQPGHAQGPQFPLDAAGRRSPPPARAPAAPADLARFATSRLASNCYGQSSRNRR